MEQTVTHATKVMITGATGLLGRALLTELSPHFDVVGTGFSRAEGNIIKLDLHDQQAVANSLIEHKPQVVIHAAAERNPDICSNKPEQAIALNVAASKFLAEQCEAIGAKLILISTDYVFDGQDAPYLENAAPNPLNLYGQSKQQAEQAVLAVAKTHSVIRVPVLYGDVTHLGESAVTTLAQQLSATAPSRHDNWAIRYPTHVADIAMSIRDLIQQQDKLGGIFHISGTQKMTKYQMACLMADALGYDSNLLEPLGQPNDGTPRPYNCALENKRLKAMGIHYERGFAKAIAETIRAHITE